MRSPQVWELNIHPAPKVLPLSIYGLRWSCQSRIVQKDVLEEFLHIFLHIPAHQDEAHRGWLPGLVLTKHLLGGVITLVQPSAPMVCSKVLLNMTYTRSWEQDPGVTPSLLSLTTKLLYKNLVEEAADTATVNTRDNKPFLQFSTGYRGCRTVLGVHRVTQSMCEGWLQVLPGTAKIRQALGKSSF